MAAAPALDETASWAELVEIWENVDLPNAGWRAEIIEGRVVMTPPPGNAHNLIADRVHRMLLGSIPQDWVVFQTGGIKIPERKNLCVPHLVVVPSSAVRTEDSATAAENLLLVVEITSPGNARDDRTQKLWGYGQAGIPLYLLIDRFDEDGAAVTLFSDPCDGRYRLQRTVAFGDPIELPEPFALTVDTSEF